MQRHASTPRNWTRPRWQEIPDFKPGALRRTNGLGEVQLHFFIQGHTNPPHFERGHIPFDALYRIESGQDLWLVFDGQFCHGQ